MLHCKRLRWRPAVPVARCDRGVIANGMARLAIRVQGLARAFNSLAVVTVLLALGTIAVAIFGKYGIVDSEELAERIVGAKCTLVRVSDAYHCGDPPRDCYNFDVRFTTRDGETVDSTIDGRDGCVSPSSGEVNAFCDELANPDFNRAVPFDCEYDPEEPSFVVLRGGAQALADDTVILTAVLLPVIVLMMPLYLWLRLVISNVASIGSARGCCGVCKRKVIVSDDIVLKPVLCSTGSEGERILWGNGLRLTAGGSDSRAPRVDWLQRLPSGVRCRTVAELVVASSDTNAVSPLGKTAATLEEKWRNGDHVLPPSVATCADNHESVLWHGRRRNTSIIRRILLLCDPLLVGMFVGLGIWVCLLERRGVLMVSGLLMASALVFGRITSSVMAASHWGFGAGPDGSAFVLTNRRMLVISTRKFGLLSNIIACVPCSGTPAGEPDIATVVEFSYRDIRRVYDEFGGALRPVLKGRSVSVFGDYSMWQDVRNAAAGDKDRLARITRHLALLQVRFGDIDGGAEEALRVLQEQVERAEGGDDDAEAGAGGLESPVAGVPGAGTASAVVAPVFAARPVADGAGDAAAPLMAHAYEVPSTQLPQSYATTASTQPTGTYYPTL